MRRRAALAAVLGLAAACSNPTVLEIGGIRIEPRDGRGVLDAEGAQVFVDIHSTGKFGDVLAGVETPAAARARLVGPAGATLDRLPIPGQSVVRLHRQGPRIVLSDLRQPLRAGDVIIVTLLFEKAGAIGVVTPLE